jgi:hypothetical protein
MAIDEFGMPEDAHGPPRKAYLAYLDDAFKTTCGPNIWPPLAWGEFIEVHDFHQTQNAKG